ncbi:replication factor A protein 3 [Tuber indicum]|nr:replication factor A protein 3 [Tuber indicum]
MTEQTPRINAPLLHQFIGRTIRLVGKVTDIHGDKATLDSSGVIIARLDRDSNLKLGNATEVVAKVNPDLSVKVLTSTDFGDNLDMKVYEELVGICQQHREIFYDS